jgi:hypothetical protein
MRHRSTPSRPRKLGLALAAAALGIAGSLAGTTLAFGQSHSTATSAGSASGLLPCQLGGDHCDNIGFTPAFLEGSTVDLEYSHNFFCAEPPSSGAPSKCEAGAPDTVDPPSGPVVSSLYTLIPDGFKPNGGLHCPQTGHCIDHPSRIDLSRIGGSSDAAFPAHMNVIEENESFQSTWWPVVIVKVKTLAAWNTIAGAKSADAMDACEAAGNCSDEIPTNAYIFFQVLGPGMSPQGPA